MKKTAVLLFFAFYSLFAQNNQNITLLGEFPIYKSTDVYATTDYAFVVSYDNSTDYGKLRILNVSDPSAVSEISSYGSSGNFSPVSIFVSGNYAYAGSSTPDFRIFDITDLSNPQLLSTYEEYGNDIEVIGNTAYLASLTAGLIILNVSNKNNPNEIGYLEPGGDALAIFVKDNLAYLAYGDYGLRIIDISNPNDPKEVANYDTPDYCYDVYVSGNYIFLSDYNSLLILDGSNLSSISQVAEFSPYSINQVIVKDNFAYLADRGYGIRILDISNISSPEEVGYYKISGGSFKLDIVDNKIYSVNYDGLTILQNDLLTDIDANKPLIRDFYLSQNYPNPFNPSTTIKYSIPTSSPLANGRTEEGFVTLKVYDALGREVATLVNEAKSPGYYSVNFNAVNLPSGLYYYRLTAGEFSQTKKMILMK